MLNKFQAFACKGTWLNLAIGLMMGAAFGNLVASFVTDVILPPSGLFLGRVDFANLFINLSNQPYATLDAARAAGAPAIGFDVCLNTALNFLVSALVLVLILRPCQRAQEETPGDEPAREFQAHRVLKFSGG